MKYIKILRKLGLCASLVPLSFAPVEVNAQATIVVSGTVDLNFGIITTNGGSGTVVIDTAGARTTTGTLVTVGGGGLVSQGIFSVSGSTGLAIDLSMTNSTFTVNNGGGGTMNVNGFNMITNAGGTNATITLATSTETYPLGATLNVNASQAAGTYIGSFTVSANYQ